MVDASWAMANRGDGRFDRAFLFGPTAPQYVGWVTGTSVGELGEHALCDLSRFGLDAVYPALFLALLVAERRNGRPRGAAWVGGAIALALAPFAPPGVPVLVASVAALVGLRRTRTTGFSEDAT